MDPEIESALRELLSQDGDQSVDSAAGAVEAALVVARVLDAAAEVAWARTEIAAIAGRVLERHAAPGPDHVLEAFAKEGFHGAGERYYEIDNSMLDRVLRNRRGIPISLGVAMMGVAGQLGLDAQGVNFPRHFLVMIEDALVDPYAMTRTTVEECRKWLADNEASEQGAFDLTRPRDVVLRMLNNARILTQTRGDYARALEISDYQLLVAPDYYGLHVERADAWLGLNAPEMVVAELEKAAERAPDAKTAERLRERVAQAKRLGDSTVN